MMDTREKLALARQGLQAREERLKRVQALYDQAFTRLETAHDRLYRALKLVRDLEAQLEIEEG